VKLSVQAIDGTYEVSGLSHIKAIADTLDVLEKYAELASASTPAKYLLDHRRLLIRDKWGHHYGHNDCANVEDLFVFITGPFRTASFSTDSVISSRPGTYASSLLSAITSILLIDGFEQAL